MLTILDREGCITVAAMRALFERSVKETRVLAQTTPLGTIEVNGAFSHYMEPDTDTLWIGFAIGMRAAERAAKSTGSCQSVVINRDRVERDELLAALHNLLEAMPAPSSRSVTVAWDAARAVRAKHGGAK